MRISWLMREKVVMDDKVTFKKSLIFYMNQTFKVFAQEI